MILRRITEHVKAQNWFAVAIDFLIVVVGVFIGIEVSNWNAARVGAAEARGYLVRIEEDVRENRRDLARVMDYYRRTRRHGESALTALGAPPGALGGQFLIDLYQTTQIAPRLTRRDAYDELLASGVLNSIRNVELRQHLANYYVNDESFAVVVRNVPLLRERVRTIIPLDAQRAVRAGCAETLDVDPYGATVASLPESCALDLSAEATARAVAAITASPDLAADLTRHVADLDQKVEILELMISRAEGLSAFVVESRQ